MSFHSNPKEGQDQRIYKLHSFQMPVKLCSKLFKVRLHQYMNQEFLDAKASGFKEAEVSEIKLQTFFGPWRNQGSLRKTSNSSLTKAFYCVNHKSCGKFLK